MDLEASTASSPAATGLSTTNATTTDDKKRGGRKRARGVWRRSSAKWVREPSKTSMAANAKFNSTHGDIANSSTLMSHEHDDAGKYSLRVDSKKKMEEEVSEFVDEEAMFNMPLLVDCMAQGMLLTPPAFKKGFSWTHHNDDDTDFTLWEWD